MKVAAAILFSLFSSFTNHGNTTVAKVDLNLFAGKWYSLYSIPTFFDKGSKETTTYYTLNNKGYYDVVTTYKKADDPQVHAVKSKIFPVEGTDNAQMKAQFLWPYKVDYWVIELAPDYSYVVVGHPEHKYLFIMSRKPAIGKELYADIVARCKAKGYAVEKLTSQNHASVALASK